MHSFIHSILVQEFIHPQDAHTMHFPVCSTTGV